MAEQMALKDILSDAKPAEPQKPAGEGAEKPAGETPPERVTSYRKEWRERELDDRAAGEGKTRDPVTGQFVPKEPEKKDDKPKEPEKKAELAKPPRQELTDKERAFLATAQEERRKRQDLERRLAEQEKAKPKEPEKGFWDDPEGAVAKFREEISAVRGEMSSQIMATRLATAEAIARTRHEDFEEKINTFAEIVKTTPGLAQQWLAAPDPAEFAYRVGKTHKELAEAGNIDALREKMEKEIRLKLEDELKAKYEALAKERAALPGSLSNAHAAPQQRPVWNGPTSLKDLLKD